MTTKALLPEIFSCCDDGPYEREQLASILNDIFRLCGPLPDINLASNMIDHFGSAGGIIHADAIALQISGCRNPIHHRLLYLIRKLIRYHHHEQITELHPIQSMEALKEYAMHIKSGMHIEELTVLFFNGQSALIPTELNFSGTVDQISANYLEILRIAICVRARFVVLIHNHPTGEAAASKNDIADTVKIAQQFSLLNIHLIDHIIVANKFVYSFRENGLI